MSSSDVLRGVFRGSPWLLRGHFYSQLNVLRPCDLCPQSITHSQKCQGGDDKNSYTDLRKIISSPYKYWLEDWQYPQSILYSLSITHGVNHVSRYQSGTEATLQNHAGSWGDGRLWPASDFLGGSIWTRRIRAVDWQLRWGPECTCQLVITQQLLTVTLWAVSNILAVLLRGDWHQRPSVIWWRRLSVFDSVLRAVVVIVGGRDIKSMGPCNLQRWQFDLDI